MAETDECVGCQFLTKLGVARELGISERTVARLIEERRLAVHTFNRKAVRISRADLDAFKSASRTPAMIGDGDAA